MTEEWRKIQGWDYEVSSEGHVRSTRSGMILKGTVNRWGHLCVTLSDAKTQTTTRQIGYLVARSFIPNDYNSKKVKHLDGNKLNSNLDNLEWA
jgi:hypothetical protein